MSFAEPAWLLATLPVAVVATYALVRCFDARRLSARIGRGARGAATGRDSASVLVLAVASTSIAIALARPVRSVEGGEPARPVVDLVVALDVSTSMLADDVKPSRFELARTILADLLDRAPADRVGLVAFAGASSVLVPLTRDVDAARLFAEQLRVKSVDEPGTSLRPAVERAARLYDETDRAGRVLVVISDGEALGDDPDADASDAAAVARDARLAVVTVTVGTATGAAIPIETLGTTSALRAPDGTPVVTRARPDLMQELAGDGLALDASDEAIASRIAAFASRESAIAARPVETSTEELFQIPLALALALFALEYFVASRTR